MYKIFSYYFKFCIKFSKKKTLFFLVLAPFLAIIQSVGIITIYPLITLITKPEVILTNKYFLKYYPFFYENEFDITMQIALIFFVLNFFSLLCLYLGSIIIEFISGEITNELKNQHFSKVLNNDKYLSIVNNRSDSLNLILTEIPQVYKCIVAVLSTFQSTSLILGFLIGILIFEIKIIFFICFIILIYIFIYQSNKKILQKISLNQTDLYKQINQINIYLQLALKDLLVLKIGRKILNNFRILQDKHLNEEIKKITLILYPRYLLEIVLYISIIFYLYFNYSSVKLTENLNFFAVLLLFVWKSIPIFFNFFRQFSILNGSISSYKVLQKFENIFKIQNKNNLKQLVLKNFKKNIIIKNVSFSYNKNDFFEFDCKINKGERIHLKGVSGSGKSTFLNILTGIVSDYQGKVLIDNREISKKNVKTNLFGYVTQDVFLFNGTIAQNISLKDKNIDKEKLRKIFQICGINNLVNNFEEIFDKKLEINSPNVSGGQKQRIAIARVLYLEPEILILDEATNALDRKNEKEIIEKIQQYKKKLTLLVVTHRDINIKFNKVLLIKKINNKKFKLFNK